MIEMLMSEYKLSRDTVFLLEDDINEIQSIKGICQGYHVRGSSGLNTEDLRIITSMVIR